MPSPDMHTNWSEQHPDEGLLHEWLEEQLATEEAARVSAHVSGCGECRERVAEAHGLMAASRRILSALDDVPAGVIPAAAASMSMAAAGDAWPLRAAAAAASPPAYAPQATANATATPFRWRRWGAIAAVMLLTVSGVVVVRQGADMRRSVPPSGASSATSAGAPSRALRDESKAETSRVPVSALTSAPMTATKTATKTATAPPVTTSNAPVPGARQAPAASPPPTPPGTALVRRVPARGDAAATVVAQGSAAGGSDTLAARLEVERRRRMRSEATTADANARPRIDAIGAAGAVGSAGAGAAGPARNFAVTEKGRVGFLDSLQQAPVPMAKVTGVAGTVAFDSLVLTREPCFGRCPAYDLYVDGRGRVRYQSHLPDDTTSEKQAQLPAADFAQLRDVLDQAHVETLKSYISGTTECGRDATDAPTLRLRVFQRGRWYRVEHYLGCSAGTTVLPNLARQIDAIVGTQRWLPPGYRLN